MISIVNRLITSFNRLPVWRRQVSLGNSSIQVPNFDRWLYVKLHALRLMGSEERNFLSRHVKRGMTVLDIGANIGLYSILLAELVGNEGRVFAFEPDPVLFQAALTNSRQNGRDGVIKIQNLALGSRTERATLYRRPFNSGDNRLSASPAHREAVAVNVGRLDDILSGEKIDFIKMDVQGWEAEVLRGMQQTVRNNPALTIYFEYWPEGLRKAGEELSSPLDILRQYEFTLFLPGQTEPLSNRELASLTKRYSGNRFLNLLASRV